MTLYTLLEPLLLLVIALLALHRLVRHLAPGILPAWLRAGGQPSSSCHSNQPSCQSGCGACPGNKATPSN